MSRERATNRRDVLKLTGTAALALVAGCGDEPDAEEGTGNGQEADDADEHEVDDEDEDANDDEDTGDDADDESDSLGA
ncbi:twin-arginine translocation signal domain-containing protein [Natrononativus amylolyticus]|uniref:twin-arginine translocation signal domain-containing protein n=1 Tax=Natrononativus amylolyticus TaxID=2963434 RepID=UPI0020CBC610|nr:twin-arginine translocation signal domain-containing protein [Natrononativus amylolyticus]